MKFHIELTAGQFASLSELPDDIVQLYEHEAAELAWLLAQNDR